ncbi:MAG: hypothetical protein M3O36_09045 [Myxococcota bacterium]|nr:hypothetical protein [Myxococcota bacterium]
MNRTSQRVGFSRIALVAAASLAGCSSSNAAPTTASEAGTADASAGDSSSEASSASGDAAMDGPPGVLVLIDDMETTSHGPIKLTGIAAPLSPGYWYNSGAQFTDAGDMAQPAEGMFAFSSFAPAVLRNGMASSHAAHQVCTLAKQYDTCGVGLEFAQEPESAVVAGDAGAIDAGLSDSATVDARADAGPADAGAGDAAAADASAVDAPPPTDAMQDGSDAAVGIPMTTVPFDISSYQGITFWGRSDSPGDGGTLDVKVQFPNTDTDPRGGQCNGVPGGAAGPADHTQCYNSYAEHFQFTSTWQQFTLLFRDARFAVDPTWGWMFPPKWTGKNVYGVNWQAQKNSLTSDGPITTDIWVDDVYFIQ